VNYLLVASKHVLYAGKSVFDKEEDEYLDCCRNNTSSGRGYERTERLALTRFCYSCISVYGVARVAEDVAGTECQGIGEVVHGVLSWRGAHREPRKAGGA